MTAFDWTTERALSVKALIEADGLSDDTIEAVKNDLAAALERHIPVRAWKVSAAVAEPGSRSWSSVGAKITNDEAS